MSERTPQTKAALRVFGYDPEGPTEAPKPAPSVQPVWTEKEIEDWIKTMGGPWFIPPCFIPVPERAPFENKDFERLVERAMEGYRVEVSGSAINVSPVAPPEVIAKTRDFPAMTWADAVNAAYAHLNRGPAPK